ncbi:MAG: hypothetical protein IKN55_07240 [Oscillospiraceae bacterium]|nr:hypothetical protein [Oscillospiraceae bacterium]
METLKQILEQYQTEEHLSFMGMDYPVEPGRNVYNRFRIKYYTLAGDALKTFRECEKQFQKIDDLLDGFADAMAVSMDAALHEAIQDFISIGVYNVDQDTLLEMAEQSGAFDGMSRAIQVFYDGSDQIRSRLKMNAAQRERAKANRARWQVTTIGGGMLDAIGDQMKAGALNAASGAGASVKNAFAAAADEADADEKLDALFRNEKYRSDLRNSVYNATVMLHSLFLKHLPDGTSMTKEDVKNGNVLCNNVIDLQLSREQQIEMTYRSLQLNPFNYNNYKALFEKFPEFRPDLVRIASFFGMVGIVRKAAAIITEYVKNHLGTTEQDAKNCRAAAIEYIKTFGLRPNDCMDAFQILDAQDAKLDQEFRTVQGVTLQTREQAAAARNDIQTYDEILETTQEFLTIGDYHAHLEKIKALPMEPAVKNRYLQRYQTQLSAFEKKCKKAQKYAYVQAHHNLPFYNGSKLDMLIHYGILALLIIGNISGIFHRASADSVAFGNFWVIVFSIYMFIVKVILSKSTYDTITQKGKYALDQIVSEDTSDKLCVNQAGTPAYRPHPLVIVLLVFMLVFAGITTLISPKKSVSGGTRSVSSSSSQFVSQELIDDLASAMNDRDAMELMKYIMPDILYNQMTSADVETSQKALNQMDGISMTVIAETPLDAETLDKCRIEYLGIGAIVNITKGYCSTINVTLYGQTHTSDVYVLYLEGEGWKLYFNDIGTLFS